MANGGLFGPQPLYGTHSHVSGHEIEHLDKILDEGRTNATLIRTVDGHRSETGVGGKRDCERPGGPNIWPRKRFYAHGHKIGLTSEILNGCGPLDSRNVQVRV